MKKLLFALLAIILLVVGCGTVVGTSHAPTTQLVFSTPETTSTNSETACQLQQSQLSLLKQEVKQGNADLVAAHGEVHVVATIKVTLLKLHLRMQQAQKAYKHCQAHS